ncbi:MAG TPA: hypothetical protein VMU53_05915 [Candidatus Sulfotelmatobacter sp.]|nr:hypothetical protein [Candidatus Sulfotelmatobacter sp.]
MGLPPDAVRHFAKQHVEAIEKHLFAVEDNMYKESAEDRHAFEKFYNNLALFSGGTIALSITYLGYLKSLGKPLLHPRLLTASWASLFICLVGSLLYVLLTLYYSHHFREREYNDVKRRKYEIEAEETPKIGVVNLRTPQEIAEFQKPRLEAARNCAAIAEKHKTLQDRYLILWRWCGRVAQLGFASGIGMLLWFAISNS